MLGIRLRSLQPLRKPGIRFDFYLAHAMKTYLVRSALACPSSRGYATRSRCSSHKKRHNTKIEHCNKLATIATH
jgi:hypothetical protein